MAVSPDYTTRPSPYDDAIAQAEKANGIPVGLLRKQLIAESGLNPAAKSNAPNSHATGIAQFEPATASSVGLADPTDPVASINAAAKVDAQNYSRFGNWGKALLAYHDGPHAVKAGNISPAALAYREKIASMPDFNAAPSKIAAGADPFAVVDQAHAAASPAVQEADPFAQVDAAHAQTGASGGPAIAAPTPAQIAQADVTGARQTYDTEDFPTRAAISAGQGMEDFVHGAQGVGTDIVEGLGNLVGSNKLTAAAQQKRNELAVQEAAVAPAREGEHGLSNIVGQAAPYVASAPLGGPEIAGLRLLPRLGVSALRNALVGGGIAGTATTSTTDQGAAPSLSQDIAQRARNAATGAVMGGVLGPAAETLGTGIGMAGKYVANKLSGLMGGAEASAAGHVASVAPNTGAPDLSAAQKVPGYTPNAAEATGDPRLAWLDKTLRNKFDDYRAQADATDEANNTAIQNSVQSIRGDRATLAKLYADRAAATGPMYQDAATQAAQAGARVNTTPVWTAIQNAMKAKQGETSVTNALSKYLVPGDGLYDTLPNGKMTLTNDVQRLANIRNQMSTDIGKQFATDSAGNDMKAAAKPLMAVRDVIDQQLAQANPALAAARDKFAELSQPINQQEALQNLLPPEKDANQFTPARMASVLQKLRDAQASSGATPEKALTPEHMQQLQDIHDVLANRANARAAQPGADVKSQVNDVVNHVSDTGGWNPLLMAEHAGRLGGTAAGGAAGFLGLGHVHPGLAMAMGAAGNVAGGALGRTAAKALERSPAATRTALANMLLDPAHNPIPTVAPAAYTRSRGGYRAAEGLARGTTNALTSGQRNDQSTQSSP